MKRTSQNILMLTLLFLFPFSILYSQQKDSDKGMMLLTIFLKHDQSKTLAEIQEQLAKTQFWEKFPPPGAEVVSWYVVMGIGQVVTLRFPAEKLRDVNLAIEKNAWGAFRTEFYPTYDFRNIWETKLRKKKPMESSKTTNESSKRTTSQLNINEAPLAIGAVRSLSVVPYGKLKYSDTKISIQELSLDDNPTLSVVGIEVGNATIELTDYKGNLIIYTIPIEEKQVDVWKLEIQQKYTKETETAKLKLIKEWMDFGKYHLRQKETEPSSYFDAYEKLYLAELLLNTWKTPPPTLKEVKKMREEIGEDLDRIFKIKKVEFNEALKVNEREKAEKIIEFLKKTFPSENYFNLKTGYNYRKNINLMENHLKQKE